jgi:hypothetical protein
MDEANSVAADEQQISHRRRTPVRNDKISAVK